MTCWREDEIEEAEGKVCFPSSALVSHITGENRKYQNDNHYELQSCPGRDYSLKFARYSP